MLWTAAHQAPLSTGFSRQTNPHLHQWLLFLSGYNEESIAYIKNLSMFVYVPKKNFFIFFLDHIPSDLLKEVSPLFVTPLQFSSVAQSCPTLCDPMNRSTPGFPVHHQLPEFTQTHVHQVSDAIQPSHPLSSPSPPAPNPSQHQSLFQ